MTWIPSDGTDKLSLYEKEVLHHLVHMMQSLFRIPSLIFTMKVKLFS